MILTALFMLLLVISGGLIVSDRNRRLRPFDRATTDSLRGLLALLIVAHHLSMGTHVPFLSPFCNSLGAPIVAIFFLLSGYGLCYSFKKKGNNYINGFLAKRYSKILPSFVALSCLAIAIAVFEGSSLRSQMTNLVFKGVTPLPNSWFLYAIIYIYASFFISALIAKTPRRTGLCLIGFNLVYVFLTVCVGRWGSWWFISIPSVNLGHYIALYENKIERIISRYSLLVYSSAVIMIFIAFCAQAKMPSFTATPYFLWESFWLLAFAGAAYLIIRVLGSIRWKPLVWLSVISMEIYLIHGLPIKYMKNAEFVPLSSSFNALIYIIVVYATSITFAWLIHKLFLKKPAIPK